MKRLLKFSVFSLFIIVIILTGCTTIKDTLYLRQAEVTGPIYTPPIHIVDSVDTPSLTVSPKFTLNTKKSFTGEVDQRIGFYNEDTSFVPAENSLIWNVTTFTAGLDLDLQLSRSFAITMGAIYSSGNNFNAWGGNFGIGIFGYKNGTALRLDLGIQISSMEYDAYTVLHRSESGIFGNSESTYYFYDSGTSTHVDPYLSLTWNTAHKDWLLNIFINGGYSLQSLFSFEPGNSYLILGVVNYTRTDERGSTTAGFFHVTPGIYFFINESSRVLVGTRFFIESQIGEADSRLFILPMLQLDFTL